MSSVERRIPFDTLSAIIDYVTSYYSESKYIKTSKLTFYTCKLVYLVLSFIKDMALNFCEVLNHLFEKIFVRFFKRISTIQVKRLNVNFKRVFEATKRPSRFLNLNYFILISWMIFTCLMFQRKCDNFQHIWKRLTIRIV